MSNSMNLNALLRVSYTEEEKIVHFNYYRLDYLEFTEGGVNSGPIPNRSIGIET